MSLETRHTTIGWLINPRRSGNNNYGTSEFIFAGRNCFTGKCSITMLREHYEAVSSKVSLQRRFHNRKWCRMYDKHLGFTFLQMFSKGILPFMFMSFHNPVKVAGGRVLCLILASIIYLWTSFEVLSHKICHYALNNALMTGRREWTELWLGLEKNLNLL